MTIRTLAILAALLLPSAAAHAENPLLTATVGVGDGFNITLKDANGAAVKHLDAGTYDIHVRDVSEIHNFHLFGPGVDKATVIENKEDVTWTVTLTDGKYTFQCDPHLGVMHGTFTVGAVVTPPPPTKLKATVGPGRTIALRNANGTKLKTLAGSTSVVISVTDRSKTDNFRLTGKGVNKATGVAFRGRVTWKLTLAPGKYTYRSDRHKTTMRGSFIVPTSAFRA